MKSGVAAYLPSEMSDLLTGELDNRCRLALEIASRELNEPEDAQLLEQVAAGCRESLSLLFRRHARGVYLVALRILRDEAEAADLRQEVFLYVVDRAGLFDPAKGSGASWIRQITHHRAIDRRRYLDVRQHYNSEEFDEQITPVTTVHSFQASLDGKAIRDRLSQQLTVDQQQTLELHLFEGYSLREIAEKRGQTIGNVKHHYYRALERLRSQLFPQKRG